MSEPRCETCWWFHEYTTLKEWGICRYPDERLPLYLKRHERQIDRSMPSTGGNECHTYEAKP